MSLSEELWRKKRAYKYVHKQTQRYLGLLSSISQHGCNMNTENLNKTSLSSYTEYHEIHHI